MEQTQPQTTASDSTKQTQTRQAPRKRVMGARGNGASPSRGGQNRQKRNTGQGGARGRNNRRRNQERGGSDGRPDFEQKVVDIRRVARVVAGGRRFSFSATIVVGDRNGSVGVGTGKGADTAAAIEKGVRIARKNMVTIPRTKSHSIPHEVTAKFCGSEIFITPAAGHGLVAGSSARVVLTLAGISDVSAKMLSRSKNKLNNAKVTIKALQKLEQ